MSVYDKKTQEIVSKLNKEANKLATITGLPIAICLESISILIAERKKGKSLEEGVQVADAFLNEKRQLLCTNITTATQAQNSH